MSLLVCSPNLGRLEGIFLDCENLTICWCVKEIGKRNVSFHIVHFVNVVGMWVSAPVPPIYVGWRGYFGTMNTVSYDLLVCDYC